ncbi:hypothetical protein AXX17_AT1G02850 [Arabidopsis thaliana]|uniref:MATH domain-containing protein n=1 Tax=Arabidopsis thaliana TaxID=3702 RepID=A0A178WB56_ARATH|nr:hypothetical protein AXX17_AT1G02850 [Arabidopsis thaliana]
MGTELRKVFSWDINNLSDENHPIRSKSFSSGGGCEWCIILHPKGYPGYDNHLSLFLNVPNLESLRLGWKRRTRFFFVILNQSGNELCRSPRQSTENDILQHRGLPILASQALSFSKILSRHPDFEVDFVPKYQELLPVYLTLFFCLIETLSKSPQSLSADELTNAQNQLSELTKVGFKLDWLKSKLEELSLERKKAVPDACHVLHERVKNVELTLSNLQVKLDKDRIKYAAAAAGVSSFGFIGFFIKRFVLSCFSV